jgi:hypothetical protein
MYRSALAWMPLLLLLAGLCIPQSYWCSPTNPGGKELACGLYYARTEVKNTIVLFEIFGASAFIATGWYATQRRLSAWGLWGLAISAALIGLVALAKLRYGIIDSP